MEPEQLRRGKEFHEKVQSDWKASMKDGHLSKEHPIKLTSVPLGSKHVKSGRLDVFVDELADFVSVIEIKSTDWNKIKPSNVQKLLGSHRRQIWRYISKYLDSDKVDVCPGIIYPDLPSSSELRGTIPKLVEIRSAPFMLAWSLLNSG